MTKLEEAFIKVHWFEKYFQRKSAVKKQLFLKKFTFAHFSKLRPVYVFLKIMRKVAWRFIPISVNVTVVRGVT